MHRNFVLKELCERGCSIRSRSRPQAQARQGFPVPFLKYCFVVTWIFEVGQYLLPAAVECARIWPGFLWYSMGEEGGTYVMTGRGISESGSCLFLAWRF